MSEYVSPYDKYLDEVKYDFTIIAKINISKLSASELKSLEQTLQRCIDDEDFIAMYFKQPSLGRVYMKYAISDDKLVITAGVSDIDANENFTSDSLVSEMTSFISNFDKIDIEYELPQEYEIKVISNSSSNVDMENVDKMLVSEGKLLFKCNGLFEKLVLTDEGNINHFKNNNIVNTIPFSKTNLIKEYKSIINNGGILQEAEIISDNDLNKEKQNIEQSIDKVDELQSLKDELMDKVDKLVNESKDTNNFISSDYSSMYYNLSNCNELNLEDNLSDSQKEYIVKNICSLAEFKQSFIDLLTILSNVFVDAELSIDEYISSILEIADAEECDTESREED